jgi:hypothetical protein
MFCVSRCWWPLVSAGGAWLAVTRGAAAPPPLTSDPAPSCAVLHASVMAARALPTRVCAQTRLLQGVSVCASHRPARRTAVSKGLFRCGAEAGRQTLSDESRPKPRMQQPASPSSCVPMQAVQQQDPAHDGATRRCCSCTPSPATHALPPLRSPAARSRAPGPLSPRRLAITHSTPAIRAHKKHSTHAHTHAHTLPPLRVVRKGVERGPAAPGPVCQQGAALSVSLSTTGHTAPPGGAGVTHTPHRARAGTPPRHAVRPAGTQPSCNPSCAPSSALAVCHPTPNERSTHKTLFCLLLALLSLLLCGLARPRQPPARARTAAAAAAARPAGYQGCTAQQTGRGHTDTSHDTTTRQTGNRRRPRGTHANQRPLNAYTWRAAAAAAAAAATQPHGPARRPLLRRAAATSRAHALQVQDTRGRHGAPSSTS